MKTKILYSGDPIVTKTKYTVEGGYLHATIHFKRQLASNRYGKHEMTNAVMRNHLFYMKTIASKYKDNEWMLKQIKLPLSKHYDDNYHSIIIEPNYLEKMDHLPTIVQLPLKKSDYWFHAISSVQKCQVNLVFWICNTSKKNLKKLLK